MGGAKASGGRPVVACSWPAGRDRTLGNGSIAPTHTPKPGSCSYRDDSRVHPAEGTALEASQQARSSSSYVFRAETVWTVAHTIRRDNAVLCRTIPIGRPAHSRKSDFRCQLSVESKVHLSLGQSTDRRYRQRSSRGSPRHRDPRFRDKRGARAVPEHSHNTQQSLHVLKSFLFHGYR